MAEEPVSLAWNSFTMHLAAAFQNMYNEKSFTDVMKNLNIDRDEEKIPNIDPEDLEKYAQVLKKMQNETYI